MLGTNFEKVHKGHIIVLNWVNVNAIRQPPATAHFCCWAWLAFYIYVNINVHGTQFLTSPSMAMPNINKRTTINIQFQQNYMAIGLICYINAWISWAMYDLENLRKVIKLSIFFFTASEIFLKGFLCFLKIMRSPVMLCAKLGSYLFRKSCAAAISKGRVFTLTNHRKYIEQLSINEKKKQKIKENT